LQLPLKATLRRPRGLKFSRKRAGHSRPECVLMGALHGGRKRREAMEARAR
jgi:hypothetical protein